MDGSRAVSIGRGARRFWLWAVGAALFLAILGGSRAAYAADPMLPSLHRGRIAFESYRPGTGFMGAFNFDLAVGPQPAIDMVWQLSPGGLSASMLKTNKEANAEIFTTGWPKPAMPDGSPVPVELLGDTNGGHHPAAHVIAGKQKLGAGDVPRGFTAYMMPVDPHDPMVPTYGPRALVINPTSGVNKTVHMSPAGVLAKNGTSLTVMEQEALVAILVKQGLPEGVDRIVFDDGRSPHRTYGPGLKQHPTIGPMVAKLATPCECFVAGTPIATADGPRAVEKIRAGDQVWATDDEGRPALREVRNTFADPARPIRTVKLERDGRNDRLDTTDDHPFYVAGHGWTIAAALRAGDRVVSRGGKPARVVSSAPADRKEPTYNFEVAGSHDYYVGAFDTLVHNMCSMPVPPNRSGRFVNFVKTAGRMNVGGPGVVAGGIAVGMVGYALGGEYGALAAGFAYGTIAGKLLSQGTLSWSRSAALSGVGIAAALVTDYALEKAGVKSQWIRTTASIGVGSLVPAIYAGYAAYAAPGGTLGAAGAAGATTFAVGALWAVLAVEVTYHISQWIEIGNAIYLAANGSEAHEEALREIEKWGFGSRYDPSTYIRYGIVSWATRPGEILSDLWTHGL